MQLPLTDSDTLFEELLQASPLSQWRWQRVQSLCKGQEGEDTRATLADGLLILSVDKPLREVAGTFTALY